MVGNYFAKRNYTGIGENEENCSEIEKKEVTLALVMATLTIIPCGKNSITSTYKVK